jgi:hypothetical protein
VFIRLEGRLIDDEGPTLDLGLADSISDDVREVWDTEVDNMGLWYILTGFCGGFHREPHWLAMIEMGLYVGQNIVVEGNLYFHRDFCGDGDCDAEYDFAVTYREPLTQQIINDTVAILSRGYLGWAHEDERRKLHGKRKLYLGATIRDLTKGAPAYGN